MSDYTPPTLVTPTPGGNPGDGSLNGTLTLQPLQNVPYSPGTGDPTPFVPLLKAGKNGAVILGYDANNGTQIFVQRGTNGTRQLVSIQSSGNIEIGDSSTGDAVLILFSGNGVMGITINSPGNPAWIFNDQTGVHYVDIDSSGHFSTYGKIATTGAGVAPIYGKDVRTGLTAADASATTLYTTTAAGQVYEVAARILGTGGTITSGVYTIGWTEGGVARTATVSITATGTLSSSLFLLQPDSGTAITGQLTTLSGTSPVVNVAAVVKEDV